MAERVGKHNKHQLIQRIQFILSYKMAKWWQAITSINSTFPYSRSIY